MTHHSLSGLLSRVDKTLALYVEIRYEMARLNALVARDRSDSGLRSQYQRLGAELKVMYPSSRWPPSSGRLGRLESFVRHFR